MNKPYIYFFAAPLRHSLTPLTRMRRADWKAPAPAPACHERSTCPRGCVLLPAAAAPFRGSGLCGPGFWQERFSARSARARVAAVCRASDRKSGQMSTCTRLSFTGDIPRMLRCAARRCAHYLEVLGFAALGSGKRAFQLDDARAIPLPCAEPTHTR